MMARRKVTKARWKVWAAWLAIALGTGSLAGGFVWLRNAQVSAGHELRAAEERVANLEMEIELYEARKAFLTSRPELSSRPSSMSPDLRRLEIGEAIHLPRSPGPGEAGSAR